MESKKQTQSSLHDSKEEGPPPSFDQFNLKTDLLRGIYNYGFIKPSKIQIRSIPILLEQKDVIIKGPSGFGKTASLAISVLQLTNPKIIHCQSLILVPTRELCQGTAYLIKCIGKFLNLKVEAYAPDSKIKVEDGIQIAVFTPGRCLHMIRQKRFETEHLKLVMFDEIDEIFGRGFQDQINDLVKFIPEEAKIVMFSPTMPLEILEFVKHIRREPVMVEVVKYPEIHFQSIKQYYVSVESDECKFDTLVELLSTVEISRCVVFCNKERSVEELAEKLKEKGYLTCQICNEMDKETLTLNMEQVSSVERVIFVSNMNMQDIPITDVIPIIINYEFPLNRETYLRRVGRRGKFGRKWLAISFVTKDEWSSMMAIEKVFDTVISEVPLDITTIFD